MKHDQKKEPARIQKVKPNFTLSLDKPVYFDHDVVQISIDIDSQRDCPLYYPDMKLLIANVFQEKTKDKKKKPKNHVLFSKFLKLGDVEVVPGAAHMNLDFNLPEDIMPSSFQSDHVICFWEVSLTFQIANKPLVVLSQTRFEKSTVYIHMNEGKTSTRKSFDILGRSKLQVEVSTENSISAADKPVSMVLSATSDYRSLFIEKVKVFYRQSVVLTDKRGAEMVSYKTNLESVTLSKDSTSFEYGEALKESPSTGSLVSNDSADSRPGTPVSPESLPRTPESKKEEKPVTMLEKGEKTEKTGTKHRASLFPTVLKHHRRSTSKSGSETSIKLSPEDLYASESGVNRRVSPSLARKESSDIVLRKAFKKVQILPTTDSIRKACHQSLHIDTGKRGDSGEFLAPSVIYTANHNGVTLQVTYELVAKVTAVGELVQKLRLPITVSVAEEVSKMVFGDNMNRMLDHVQFHENEEPPIFEEVEKVSDIVGISEQEAEESVFVDGERTTIKPGRLQRYFIKPTNDRNWAYAGHIDQLRARAYTLPQRIQMRHGRAKKKSALFWNNIKSSGKEAAVEESLVQGTESSTSGEDLDQHEARWQEATGGPTEKTFEYSANQIYNNRGSAPNLNIHPPETGPSDSNPWTIPDNTARRTVFEQRYQPDVESIGRAPSISTSSSMAKLSLQSPENPTESEMYEEDNTAERLGSLPFALYSHNGESRPHNNLDEILPNYDDLENQ
ncbi:hypothetical protein SARC_01527 [Sphaeroforma arctica JP610]|uniref:Uncharacterized protein n=1 Tax=Sphaeroforma arctica JP610 TaxID=667725 RepID=A0A0L0GBP9_9EUKA|nr:hypothetical protein SARC_01527 [Sphaeroforma arctica JP610]KNC86334.1 hypothetical protein SARC_01527 [Sphaeroforma arctica JP610]|eukprot:XP_014160236.1 hypothetical protein SARC_01527 [Sphaeroforma arctica JP610]